MNQNVEYVWNVSYLLDTSYFVGWIYVSGGMQEKWYFGKCFAAFTRSRRYFRDFFYPRPPLALTGIVVGDYVHLSVLNDIIEQKWSIEVHSFESQPN